jgi:hypothetical protein
MFNFFKKKSRLTQELFNEWLDDMASENTQDIAAINFGII